MNLMSTVAVLLIVLPIMLTKASYSFISVIVCGGVLLFIYGAIHDSSTFVNKLFETIIHRYWENILFSIFMALANNCIFKLLEYPFYFCCKISSINCINFFCSNNLCVY